VSNKEIWPDSDSETLREQTAEVNKMVGHDTEITDTERRRHPTMHHTDTLDIGIVLRGEIYCLLDEEEILLRPFETVVVQGVSHGWSNRGSEPCLLFGLLLDAQPRGRPIGTPMANVNYHPVDEQHVHR